MILTPLILGALAVLPGDDAPRAVDLEAPGQLLRLGGCADSGVGGLSVSHDGRVVAFASDAANLGPEDANGRRDVFLLDRDLGRLLLVSTTADLGPAAGPSLEPSLSADGRRIAFTSFARLDDLDAGPFGDIYVRDLPAGPPRRVSLGLDGSLARGTSRAPSLSADGRLVVFQSQAPNLVPDDANGVGDVFLHDLESGTTRCLSAGTDGVPADGASRSPAISGDGRWVAFATRAPELGANAGEVLVLLDLETGSSQVVARLADGPDPRPALDLHGERLSFSARQPAATHQPPLARPVDARLQYARSKGVTRPLVRGAPDGLDADILELVATPDGGTVVFSSRTPLVEGGEAGRADVYVLDA